MPPTSRKPPALAANLPSRTPASADNTAKHIVTVLAISPIEEDHYSLQQIFTHSNWKVYFTRTAQEALSILSRNPIPVILSEQNLPDGSWKEFVHPGVQRLNPPRVIVTAGHADNQLWREVLDLSGYDVLPKPFDAKELFRVISLAWLHWKDGSRLVMAQSA